MVESLLFRLARASCRHYRTVVGAACLFLALTPYMVRGLRVDADAAAILSADDPALTAYHEHKALFGETSPVLVLLETKTTSSELMLSATLRLRDELLASPEVLSLSGSSPALVSLDAHLPQLRAALLNSGPANLAEFLAILEPAELERSLRRTRKRLVGFDNPELRDLVMRDPLEVPRFAHPFVASRFGQAAELRSERQLFFAQVASSAEDSAACRALVDDLRARIERALRYPEAEALTVELTGLPVMTGASAAVLERELLHITAAALGGLLLLLVLTLRRPEAIVLCFFPSWCPERRCWCWPGCSSIRCTSSPSASPPSFSAWESTMRCTSYSDSAPSRPALWLRFLRI